MKHIFKKKHVLETSYDDVRYMEEFLNSYQLDSEVELTERGIRYHIEMTRREFLAMCNYIGELGLMGVYPILL